MNEYAIQTHYTNINEWNIPISIFISKSNKKEKKELIIITEEKERKMYAKNLGLVMINDD